MKRMPPERRQTPAGGLSSNAPRTETDPRGGSVGKGA